MQGEKKPNRLGSEKSPYLLEHAFNPVDWRGWNKEALAKAKNDNKPIFLSIGYSTCHWCHRMREESFEDTKVAAFINKNFIPIKVDREERPEVDAYYMGAVQAMTGGGGWPLSVFLTPDLKPFYGGTYFPPEPRSGMPGFMQVLEFAANLWKEKRDEVWANSELVLRTISSGEEKAPGVLSKSTLDECYTTLAASFDELHGGFGMAPKFPLPGTLSFLLRYHHRTGSGLALTVALKTLDKMMAGGIRDHVGGGFHRYSTDRMWLIPHFEKMLYDNALLAKVYAEAYQLTKKEEYAQVARETLRWMTREMKGEEGGFCSAQDADTSEGEGTYYTWTPEELRAALGEHDARMFGALYGVTRAGNVEGRTMLHIEPGSEPTAEAKEVASLKEALYSERLRRPRPATDTKVLTSWNGLAISALAFCGATFGDEGLLGEARRAAEFVLGTNRRDGRLLRRYAGGEAGLEGTLEDYAFLVQGLLDLFEASSEPRWLSEASGLTEVMVEDFEDKARGGFYLSLEAEPGRLKESYDGPTPSGNSVAALNLVRLSELSGDGELREIAERTASFFGGELEKNPSGHTVMLAAVDMLLSGAREIVIVAPDDAKAREWRAEIFREYAPDRVVLAATTRTYGELLMLSTLLEGREPGTEARAYICQNFACKLPADSLDALRRQLREKG